jgi:hypothetical protein
VINNAGNGVDNEESWAPLNSVAVLMLPIAVMAKAQQPKEGGIEWLLRIIENRELDSAFSKGYAQNGHRLGANICVEYRYAGGKSNRLADRRPVSLSYGRFAHRTEISSGYTAHIEITYLSAAIAR